MAWPERAKQLNRVIRAIESPDPEAEFAVILAEAVRLEADYQRRSRGGRRNVDYTDRLMGVGLTEAVDESRKAIAMTDRELQSRIDGLQSSVRSNPPPTNEVPLTRLATPVAVMARRRGLQGLTVPSTLEQAAKYLEERAAECLAAGAEAAHAIPAATSAAPSSDLRTGASLSPGSQAAERGTEPITARHVGRYAELIPSPVPDEWPADEPFIGYVYVDAQAGLSLKAARGGDMPNSLRDSVVFTIRLGREYDGRLLEGRLLEPGEVETLGLPPEPEWLGLYGPQPASSDPWQVDPALMGRFHPAYPDDLQVAVHDGDPSRTGRKPEMCWVRITGRRLLGEEKPSWQYVGRPSSNSAIYEGTLINQPFSLTNVRAGDTIQFVADSFQGFPLMVTNAYIADRPGWVIGPCGICGMSELLDPPSVAIESVTAGPGELVVACPRCEGSLTVERVAGVPVSSPVGDTEPDTPIEPSASDEFGTWDIAGYGPTGRDLSPEALLADVMVAMPLGVALVDGELHPLEAEAMADGYRALAKAAKTLFVQMAASLVLANAMGLAKGPKIYDRVLRDMLAKGNTAPYDAFRPAFDRLSPEEREDVIFALAHLGAVTAAAHHTPGSTQPMSDEEHAVIILPIRHLGVSREEYDRATRREGT